VTGGSAGIGRAIVQELLREGASVCFSGRNDDAGSRTETELSPFGEAVFVQGDMRRDESCAALVDTALRRFGRVDYLVNNAFSFLAKSLDATREDWDHIFGTGPVAYARMIQLCTEPMREAGGGAVVNMSSISAHIAQRHRWTYNAAKGAVAQLTRCAALDLAELGIRVNSVSPALIMTRELQKSIDSSPDPVGFQSVWNDYHMLRRIGEPIECAGPVLFLLSDDASFITGADLPIDGGFLAMGPQGIGAHTSRAGTK
jgi:NAD(P)-dependent dehydrogenase (short-subunit alcohol dehydrogenase family)